MTQSAPAILVLAPHPDDEVVGAAIAMRRALAAGAEASVLFLTTGVPQAAWPWEGPGAYASRVERRKAEALAVADRLDFAVEGFLEIPSRGLLERIEGIRAVVSKSKAQELWVPAYEGGHQDHDAANALGHSLRSRFVVKEFAEYNFIGGRINANSFADGKGAMLLNAEERALKRELLGMYASERGNLNYVTCENEAIRELASHDYSKPAHAGTLFRERFHWVPFRHPRIDWREQSAINAELVRFISRFS